MSAIKHSTKQNSSCHIVSAVGRKLPDHSLAESPPLTSQQTEALDLFDALAEDSSINMLHDRTAFVNLGGIAHQGRPTTTATGDVCLRSGSGQSSPRTSAKSTEQ